MAIEAAAPTAGVRSRVGVEFLGSALLLIAVVGSGIQAQRLSPHDTGLALLENSVATGGALVAIILAFGSVHMNPVVSIVDALLGRLSAVDLARYLAAQFSGAIAGVVVANLMFGRAAADVSHTRRSSAGLWLAEVVATLGLLVVIHGVARSREPAVPYAVGAYITAAYWFTASTSFANPAVTVARTLSDTFAGIAPASVLPFVVAQLLGAGLALLVIRRVL